MSIFSNIIINLASVGSFPPNVATDKEKITVIVTDYAAKSYRKDTLVWDHILNLS